MDSRYKSRRGGKGKKQANFVAVKLPQDFLHEEAYDTIDGSSMEGGGQILRNSISTAALLGRSLKIVNIRAKRPRPGIELVTEMYSAELEGGSVNSTAIKFSSPQTFHSTLREFTADTQTAGSVALLQQISLPCAVFGPSDLRFHFFGGTNAANAPQMDYISKIFLPTVEKMGVKAKVEIKRRGFYPQGKGEVTLSVTPVQSLKPIELLSRGSVESIEGIAFVSGRIPFQVGERIVKAAEHFLEKGIQQLKEDKAKVLLSPFQESRDSAYGDGTGILLVATTSTGCLFGGSALGEKGKKSEEVGEEAAKELLRNLEHGGCVDEHLQDQLIIFMAFAEGESKIKTGPLTLHTETSIHFVSCLTGATFNVSKCQVEGENSFIIQCKGIGFQNPHFKK